MKPLAISFLTLFVALLGSVASAGRAADNWEIWVMDANGDNQERITDNPGTDYGSSWSPDGSKIVFASDRDGDWEIYVINADGTNQTRLTNSPGRDDEPSWSRVSAGAEGEIAFSSDRDQEGKTQIYVMNADGTNQTRLTNTPGDSSDRQPSWSPDGSQIAFASDPDGNPDIYVMDADGTNQAQLTTSSASDEDPTWSPDGNQIAFASDRQAGRYAVYVMNADGTGQKKIPVDQLEPQQSGDNLFPSWSPGRIAFASNRERKPPGQPKRSDWEIYVMNADGTNQTRLTDRYDDERMDLYPSWRPDGQQIAFSSTPEPSAHLAMATAVLALCWMMRRQKNGRKPAES